MSDSNFEDEGTPSLKNKRLKTAFFFYLKRRDWCEIGVSGGGRGGEASDADNCVGSALE